MSFHEFRLSDYRCYICGSRISPENKRVLPKYFCEICTPIKDNSFYSIRNLIDYLTEEAKVQIYEGKLIEVENIDALSFLADIGELVHTHPYYKNFPKSLSDIIILLSKKRRNVFNNYVKILIKMMPKYSNKKSIPVDRIENIHKFLLETGVVKEKDVGVGRKSLIPTELTRYVYDSIEAVTQVEKEIPLRISAAIVGYIFLEGMKLTIDWLHGGTVGEPRGIFRLYAVDTQGKIFIPKSVNAPAVFMLQMIASDVKEFSSSYVSTWLQHLKHEDRSRFIGWLSRTTPNTNRFVNPIQMGQGIYKFKINSNYIRMRDRYREYLRER